MALNVIPGTIVAYAGSSGSLASLPAQGWLLCDGSLYDRTNPLYTALFNQIGTSWGGDGANRFAVPDLRGEFLRGVSAATGIDPDAASRNSPRPDLHDSGNSGDAVGSKQSYTIQSHSHTILNNGPQYPFQQSGMGIQANSGVQVQWTFPNLTVQPFGGNETRPTNAYVYFIIKL